MVGTPAPQRDPGVSAIFAKNVEHHVDVTQPRHVVVVVARDTLERIHSCFEWRHALAHVFHDGMRSCDLQIFFSAPGCARRSYILIRPAAGSENGRIAYASR